MQAASLGHFASDLENFPVVDPGVQRELFMEDDGRERKRARPGHGYIGMQLVHARAAVVTARKYVDDFALVRSEKESIPCVKLQRRHLTKMEQKISDLESKTLNKEERELVQSLKETLKIFEAPLRQERARQNLKRTKSRICGWLACPLCTPGCLPCLRTSFALPLCAFIGACCQEAIFTFLKTMWPKQKSSSSNAVSVCSRSFGSEQSGFRAPSASACDGAQVSTKFLDIYRSFVFSPRHQRNCAEFVEVVKLTATEVAKEVLEELPLPSVFVEVLHQDVVFFSELDVTAAAAPHHVLSPSTQCLLSLSRKPCCIPFVAFLSNCASMVSPFVTLHLLPCSFGDL